MQVSLSNEKGNSCNFWGFFENYPGPCALTFKLNFLEPSVTPL
jgi:hypothetical protein